MHSDTCSHNVYRLDCANNNYSCHVLQSKAYPCTCLETECKQTCESWVKRGEIVLKCRGGDCEQSCNAGTRTLNCRGEQCSTQHCHASDCTQTCDAVTCNITRTSPTGPQVRVKCSGNGQCCGGLMSSLDSYPLPQGILSTTRCGGNRCTCTKCLGGFCSSSDSYRSNLISYAPSTASQSFPTQISTAQRKDNPHTRCE